MKVAMISRSTLFSSPGGDTVQIVNTAKSLNRWGVQAEVKLCTDAIDYDAYDLFHFFNIIRPADILYHVSKFSKPYLVSTIFVDYTEYETKARRSWRGAISRAIGGDRSEYLKAVMRRILNGEKLMSRSYLLKGHRRSLIEVANHAALLLPNSVNEYNRLAHAYGINKDYRVIPNAIDPDVFEAVEDGGKDGHLVLCASRIEGLKNQLNLVRALNGSKYNLCIIGSHSPNHKKYYAQCRAEAQSNVEFMDRVDQGQLVSLYARAKVHVLPSWFETTGLSSLEAAAMGCNIVITDKGDTREYFGDHAFYCEPDDIASILGAVDRAASAPTNVALAEKIRNNYTWDKAAEQTKAAYEQVLKKLQ